MTTDPAVVETVVEGGPDQAVEGVTDAIGVLGIILSLFKENAHVVTPVQGGLVHGPPPTATYQAVAKTVESAGGG
jgi:hypothetical protein